MILNTDTKNTVVTLDMLEARPDPQPLGARHVPVRYDEIVRTARKLIPQITKQDIIKEELSLARQEKILIALWEFGNELNGDPSTARTMQIGGIFSDGELRSAQLNLGAVISICINLMIMGGSTILRHKHTAGLLFADRLHDGLETVYAQQGMFEQTIGEMRTTQLGEDDANGFIIDMVRKDIVPSSKAKEVITNYYEPAEDWADVQGGSAWALYNSVTRAFKALPPVTKVDRTKVLGDFFVKEVI